jgi:drug/metabolite transporter (DMT)-like permease
VNELNSIVFGLLSALTWGAGDFNGGLATRKSGVYAVVIFAELIGALVLLAIALVVGEPFPSLAGWLWGIAAGLVGVIGLMALYQGLATGKMGLVAPMSAVIGGGVPILYTAIFQGLPPLIQLLGFFFGLIAVWLLSSQDGVRIRVEDLTLPLIAGLGFGFYFVLIDIATVESVYWPLVPARTVAGLLLIPIALRLRQPLLPVRASAPFVAASGTLDALGNLFFALAASTGRLDIAAVLSSLYSATTVGLAWIFLKERLNVRQWIGVAAALAAIVLVSI